MYSDIFFFQAVDGIRDDLVTGVQTCALPIYNMEFKDIFENALKNCNPVEATIELLTKCNWNCKHCYIPVHNNDGLTTDEVFKLLYELREMGVFQVTFSGGEVFYRSDAMKIIRKARELHFDVSIFTNASLLI